MLVALSLAVGCSEKIKDPKERLDHYLNKMEGYEATLEVTFKTSEKQSTQVMHQYYDLKGPYSLSIKEPPHLKGYTTTYDGDKIIEYDPKQDKSVEVKPNPVRNQVLFGTFVHNYLELEDRKQNIQEQENVLLIGLSIPGNYKYMARQVASFDKKTLNPLEVIIYDKEDREAIVMKCLDFKYNPEIK